MSGYSIDIDTAPVRAMLEQLAAKVGDLTPVMKTIGEIVVTQTTEAFEDERSPGGVAWKPSARTKVGGKTLHGETGSLRTSLSREADPIVAGRNSVSVGTNVEYAAIHQLGGRTAPHVIRPRHKKALAFGGIVVRSVNHPGSNIPARPFLPDQASLDWDEISDAIGRHLR